MSYINALADKIYNQSTSGWFGQKMNDIVGDDYQKHLINMSLNPGTPERAYGMDYQQAENEGKSGWQRVGGNAERSAAILAAIFGGGAIAGGAGDTAGGGAGAGDAGMYGSVTSSGSAPTDYSASSAGGSAGGTNWQQLAGKALAGYGKGSQQGKQQGQDYSPQQIDSNGYPQQPSAPPAQGYSPAAPTPNPYASAYVNPYDQRMRGGLYGIGGAYGNGVV